MKLCTHVLTISTVYALRQLERYLLVISSSHASLLIQHQQQAEAESPVNRAPSFKWASFVKSSRSPTKSTAMSTTETLIDTPQSSPQKAEHDISSANSRTPSDKSRGQPTSQTATGPSSASSSSAPSSSTIHTTSQSKPSRQDSSDNLKSFKVSLDDPAWKVLPAALKKYKINNDDWQNYAMFICYGSQGAQPHLSLLSRSSLMH